MSEDRKTLKELLLGILIFVGPVLAIGLIVVEDKLGYFLGIALGAGFSIILLLHMNYSIGEALKRSPKQAERHAMINYYLRGIMTIVVVMIAILVPKIDIIGTLLGLFAMKVSALLNPYISRNNKSESPLDQ